MSVLDLIEVRRAAKVRFAANSRAGLFLALGGISTDDAQVAIDGPMILERLASPPRINGSENTLREAPNHQLVCLEASFENDRWSIDGLFWTVSSLLRLRSGGMFVACEIAQYPWDVVDGLPPDAHDRRFLPTSRRAPWWDEHVVVHVSTEDGRWVGEHLDDVLRLRGDRKFHFALECFDGAFEETDVRMAISKAWAGIEGLFGVSSELRFRIALYVATVLCPPGPDRLRQFKASAKLYDQRSKVVHGVALSAEALRACAVESLGLLRGLLVDVIERRSVRATRDIEAALLGAPLT